MYSKHIQIEAHAREQWETRVQYTYGKKQRNYVKMTTAAAQQRIVELQACE